MQISSTDAAPMNALSIAIALNEATPDTHGR
jgi:hypothetical protein